jgi:hypothetical protein
MKTPGFDDRNIDSGRLLGFIVRRPEKALSSPHLSERITGEVESSCVRHGIAGRDGAPA